SGWINVFHGRPTVLFVACLALARLAIAREVARHRLDAVAIPAERRRPTRGAVGLRPPPVGLPPPLGRAAVPPRRRRGPARPRSGGPRCETHVRPSRARD